MKEQTGNLKKAKELLSGGYTVVMCRDGEIYTSSERGVKPLVDLLKENRVMTGFSAADKIVGRAAAFLYVLLGVTEVYAEVMSEGAEKLLRGHNIEPSCGCLAEKIINRAGTGICPMENAVMDIPDESPDRALSEIICTISRLAADKK